MYFKRDGVAMALAPDTKDFSLNYELAQPADSKDLVSLYQEFYPGLLWSDDYLQWQYFNNPAGPARVWIAKSSSKIIATYAAVPHFIRVGDRTATGWRIQDALTRPEYRGYGIYHAFSRMAKKELIRSEYPLNFTFPNEKSYAGFVKTGWRPVFKIPLRIISIPETFEKAVSSSTSFEPLEKFNPECDEVWRAAVSAFSIQFAIERSADYLNWRYFSRPGAEYAAYLAKHKQDKAVLILKFYERENGERWAHLCDYFQSAENAVLTQDALSHALRLAEKQRCRMLSCWIAASSPLSDRVKPSSQAEEIVENRWFVINQNGPLAANKDAANEKQWHLSMGDSDVY